MAFRPCLLGFALGSLLLVSASQAAVEISIQSQGIRRVPIAIALFAGEASDHRQYSRIIATDLRRSGLFNTSHGTPAGFRPFATTPDYRSARASNFEFVLTGRADNAPDGSTKVTFQLFDTIIGKAREAFSYTVGPSQERLVAHLIANWVTETIIGQPGIFTSKIAYVVKTGSQKRANYELKVADYDGYNPQSVVKSIEPLISPEWDSNGDSLFYVSYERQRPIIYKLNLLTGETRAVAVFHGNNSAPALSPDRRWLAAALSETGTTEIHLLTIDGTRRRKLRQSNGINTEPDYSPVNAAEVVFVSDELGSPQLFIKNLTTNKERRLTRGSTYNVSPAYAPDGTMLAYIRRDSTGFNVHIIDAQQSDPASIPITGVRLAASPSFSPDGTMIMYKNEDSPSLLYTVSINGKIALPFAKPETGEIINPTWGPAKSNWY